MTSSLCLPGWPPLPRSVGRAFNSLRVNGCKKHFLIELSDRLLRRGNFTLSWTLPRWVDMWWWRWWWQQRRKEKWCISFLHKRRTKNVFLNANKWLMFCGEPWDSENTSAVHRPSLPMTITLLPTLKFHHNAASLSIVYRFFRPNTLQIMSAYLHHLFGRAAHDFYSKLSLVLSRVLQVNNYSFNLIPFTGALSNNFCLYFLLPKTNAFEKVRDILQKFNNIWTFLLSVAGEHF